jgi:nitrite reductase/ring-hydroxylating ferredoxin subunit
MTARPLAEGGGGPPHSTEPPTALSVSADALGWAYVLDDTVLREGDMVPVYPLGVNVVLARVGGAIHALSGRCAHMACPLFMGRLDAYEIVCPCHDWHFDVRTGRFVNAPELGLTVYATKLEAGKLFVHLGAEPTT